MTIPATGPAAISSASTPPSPAVSNKPGAQPTTPRPAVAPPGLGPAAARRRTTDTAGDAADDNSADVHWPVPSPLDQWWTEVMDGAHLPGPRHAA